MYSNLSYYVVAHQDDWQLFYGQQAFLDLQESGARVVFIYTTAGDAGESEQWWRARERGALAAQALPTGNAPPAPQSASVNGHSIATYDGGSFVSYHMRLPDGHPNGGGFPSTGHTSLGKLQKGDISQFAAIDGSTAYTSWDDFCATLRALIERERSSPNVWLNAADWSWRCSPADHADHKATSEALRQATADRFNRLWFVTYSTRNRTANLSREALQKKESVWRAYKQQVEPLADPELLRWEWNAWGGKSYFRRVRAGQTDSGLC